MHTYIYIHIHIHTYIHIYSYTYIYTYMYIYIYIYMHTYVHKYVCVYIYMNVHIHEYIFIHTFMFMLHTYICAHTHTHKCVLTAAMSSIKSGALRHSAAATAALLLKRISQSQHYIVALQSTFSADRLLRDSSFYHLSTADELGEAVSGKNSQKSALR